jgi:hypothetical protein
LNPEIRGFVGSTDGRHVDDFTRAERCFLDIQDIEILEHFPRRLSEALLGARVMVAFIDPTYFQRWYCDRRSLASLWLHIRPQQIVRRPPEENLPTCAPTEPGEEPRASELDEIEGTLILYQ